MTPQEIAKKIFDNAPAYILGADDASKTYCHTERVVNLCYTFTKALPTKISVKDTLYDVAWLHDTGKTVDDDNHHKKEVIRKALTPYQSDLGYDDKAMDNLVEIIHTHKGQFSPPTNYELESAILRICDKLDKYTQAKQKKAKGKEKKAAKKFAEAETKCKDSMLQIQSALDAETWSAFEKAYQAIRAQVCV